MFRSRGFSTAIYPSSTFAILSNGKYKRMNFKFHYLNGSRNRDISFFSSSSFVGGICLLLGVVGLFAASDMVSAITSSLSTSASRREALSEVG